MNRIKYITFTIAAVSGLVFFPGAAAAEDSLSDGFFQPAEPAKKVEKNEIRREKYDPDRPASVRPAEQNPGPKPSTAPPVNVDSVDGAMQDTSNMFALPTERANQRLPGQDPRVEGVMDEVKKVIEDRKRNPADYKR